MLLNLISSKERGSYMLALTLEKQNFSNKFFIRNYDRWGD